MLNILKALDLVLLFQGWKKETERERERERGEIKEGSKEKILRLTYTGDTCEVETEGPRSSRPVSATQ